MYIRRLKQYEENIFKNICLPILHPWNERDESVIMKGTGILGMFRIRKVDKKLNLDGILYKSSTILGHTWQTKNYEATLGLVNGGVAYKKVATNSQKKTLTVNGFETC